jgi:Cytochrome C biogenesis protein transmembrane region
MFVLGFTLAFVALGATASTLGSFLRTYQLLLRQIGGVILVIFGLHLTGILKLSIFYWQKRFEFRPSRPSYPTSLLIGLIFAIGWTPCVGLILGPTLGLAASAATLRQGVTLLLFSFSNRFAPSEIEQQYPFILKVPIRRFIGDDGDQAVHEMGMISAAHPAKPLGLRIAHDRTCSNPVRVL